MPWIHKEFLRISKKDDVTKKLTGKGSEQEFTGKTPQWLITM